MKIKCICNKVNDLPKELVGEDRLCVEQVVFHLTIGKIYTVYAMTVCDSIVLYFICDDTFTSVPAIVPSPFFEIIDPRLSRYWIFSCTEAPDSTQLYIYEWAFKEWASDYNFYKNLSEWEQTEEDLFALYKKKMDLEFPDPTIRDLAEIGDRDWLMCPKCVDAWYWPSDRDAMVVCPNCNTTYNNPRYQDSPF